MLHAIIKTPTVAFHLDTPVNAYNMQNLRWHVNQMASGRNGISMTVDMDPCDVHAFCWYAREWLPRMTRSGAVRVETSRLSLKSLEKELQSAEALARLRPGMGGDSRRPPRTQSLSRLFGRARLKGNVKGKEAN